MSTSGVLPTGMPRARRGVEVDVVGADRVVGDRAQLGRGVEQRLVDGVREQTQQALDVGDVLAQLVGRRREPVRPHVDVVRVDQPVERGAGDAAGDEAAGHCERRILVVRVARMSARLTLLARHRRHCSPLPTAASAATKNGITPTSPKAGKSDPGRQAPDHEGAASRAPGQVYVHVCKSKKKDSDGVICHQGGDRARPRRRAASSAYKPQFFDFPAFWLNSPGTYYWQAHRIACEGGDTSDCRQEGPIVKFRVAG